MRLRLDSSNLKSSGHGGQRSWPEMESQLCAVVQVLDHLDWCDSWSYRCCFDCLQVCFCHFICLVQALPETIYMPLRHLHCVLGWVDGSPLCRDDKGPHTVCPKTRSFGLQSKLSLVTSLAVDLSQGSPSWQSLSNSVQYAQKRDL